MKCNAEVYWSSGGRGSAMRFRIDVEGDLSIDVKPLAWIMQRRFGLIIYKSRADRMIVGCAKPDGMSYADVVTDVAVRFERSLLRLAELSRYRGLTFEVKAVDNYDHPDGSFCEPQDDVTEVA